MDQYGPEMVCQDNFVSIINSFIEEAKERERDEYNVGFIDGLIFVKKLFQE